jgi:hypothetical protein
MSKAILISREDLVRYTPISGNLDFDRVQQYVEMAQDIHIHELLGSNLYKKIQSDIIANTLSGDYLALVNDYIRPTLIQYSFLEFLPFSQFSVSNKGVFKHTSEAAETLTKDDLMMMIEATRDTAQNYATRLVDYLCNYPEKFPEYLTNTKEELSPTRKTSFGGWNI